MRRRDLIIAGAALFASADVHAQPPGRPSRIGYLGSNEKDSEVLRAFLQALGERGFSEGRNLELTLIDYATSGGSLSENAAALLAAKPVLVVADGPEAVLRAVRDQSADFPQSSSRSITTQWRGATRPVSRVPAVM
jgi:hypothetical protein